VFNLSPLSPIADASSRARLRKRRIEWKKADGSIKREDARAPKDRGIYQLRKSIKQEKPKCHAHKAKRSLPILQQPVARHDQHSSTRPSIFDLISWRASSCGAGSVSDRATNEFWRSLDELAGAEEFREMLGREFPRQASEWNDPVGRRRFLRLMGASLALAGLTCCTVQPEEFIVPYVTPPEGFIPGKPLFFATAMSMGGSALGVLVESHMGRPTKIEGNPNHPASLGATNVFAQASILTLYDPDRSKTVNYRGDISTWSAFITAVQTAIESQRASGGAGLRFLTGSVISPTLADQLQQLLKTFPSAKWSQYEPVNRDNVMEGARLAFGEPLNAIYKFENADVILSLDSDFLQCGPASTRYSREFAMRRKLTDGKREMNRLYAIESAMTNTGAVADHRLAARPSEIEPIARAVAANIGAPGAQAAQLGAAYSEWVAAASRDLQAHRGSSVVIVGDEQPAIVHAIGHAINQALGNFGQTVVFTQPVEYVPVNQAQSLNELVAEMDAGRVETLVIIGVNPVYSAPADLNFAEKMKKVKTRVHLGLYYDETSALCDWHIPETHYLESWSDARAFDGTVTIIQPLIAPLYEGKSAHELLAAFTDQTARSGYDIVRDYWKVNYERFMRPAGAPFTSTGFEDFWFRALQDGVVPNSAFPTRTVSVGSAWAAQKATPSQDQAQGDQLEILFRPDPSIYDGRFANNGWLQELPKPLTKITWDNVALISPATAQRLGVSYHVSSSGGEHGQVMTDVVELRYKGRSIRAPIWIMPGHADGCVTAHLGYGRWRAGEVGDQVGFNAYALRTSDAPWNGSGLEARRVGESYPIACTQFHSNMEGRAIVRSATLAEFERNPNFAREVEPSAMANEADGEAQKHSARQSRVESLPSFYPEYQYDGYAWGMAIDLNSCTGCNACVIACQSENNIPIVGKEEVMRAREMHWLRIDRYYKGAVNDPETYFQPLPCMHCEKAPCEVVCPVNATVHDNEGLNLMVYNRCVGTRYCSNNCPYKVRRFNFFLYSDWTTPSLESMRNPEVSVRSRGVMEKCTYCVQRIWSARIEAQKENRHITDGEVETACQSACPTEAIIFGDINDPSSRAHKLKADPRNYGLLAELNTRPRTTYLAAVRNTNPEIERPAEAQVKR
jgi:molybdopterin-containing oxidoreductase family iron-sulfur binding subunit